MRYADDCSCDEPREENCGCGSRDVVGSLNGGLVCEACWPDELAESNRRKAARKAEDERRFKAKEARLLAVAATNGDES